MAAHTHDEAFHEIQLNGKQLVFLFMSATVVSVVIFLLGVLVGRNVRVQRTAIVQAESIAESPAPDAAPYASAPAPVQAAADPTMAAPPPTVDDTADGKGGSEDESAAEILKPAAPRTVPEAVSTPPAAAERVSKPRQEEPAPARTQSVPKAAEAAAAPPPAVNANGYAVQVAALNVRGEADAIAKRLTSKGYAAYVQQPVSGTPTVYRVRVGTFKTRREAESVAAKLQKEEQFKPWVTR